ncbi:GNAT family N-acetyltransferase [Vibrio diazotrophicus]|uniref:GNAT family N-acetyltransferase n=1 Tax=Vibrio diazotrophicus TaxID=685 RepID=UPI000C9DE312|nr:GNAT family N-acetyltransferase [Vibrio diazotrophicus]PNH87227.1 GNAT family N-acetyltransferase [Vibrio diazotrophicus]
MPELKFGHLDPIKLPLLKRFYKQHYPSTKPKSDELSIVAYSDFSMVAVVRFRPIAEYRLLTGMAVDESQRGEGIGSQLLNYCLNEVLAKSDFCFSYTHLQNFYEQANFKKIDIEELPNDLRTLFLRYSQNGKDLIPMQFFAERSEV